MVGTYSPIDPGGAYWFDDTRGYFGGQQRRDEQRTDAPVRTLEAAFVGTGTFARLTASEGTQVLAVEDLLLDPAAVRRADLPRLRSDLDALGVRLAGAGLAHRGFSDAVSTGLRSVLDAADDALAGTGPPILVVLAELVLLGLAVLVLVVADAAEARGGEIALAKLRGLPTGATLAFGLLETVLLVLLAVPLGVVVALAALGAAAPNAFGAGLGPRADAGMWTAVAVTALGALVAAVLGSVRTMRRPVVEQWRRTAGRRTARASAVEVVVVTLALAGGWQLWHGGLLRGRSVDVAALVAPALLALAGALLGARALPLLAGAIGSATRRGRHVGIFVGARGVARRPGGVRLLVVLATAFAMVTFAVVGADVFAANRHDRAMTEVGAARVVHVDPAGPADVETIVRRLDPAGTQAMAVTAVPSSVFGATSADRDVASGPSRDAFTLLLVDPARFAATAAWRSDFAAAGPAGLVSAIDDPVRAPVGFRGDAIRMTTKASVPCCGPLTATLEVVGPGRRSLSVLLGPVRTGTTTLSVRTPACAAGCSLRRLVLDRSGPGSFPVVADLTVATVETHAAGGGWTAIPAAVDPAGWRAYDTTPEDLGGGEPVAHLTAAAAGGGVRVTVAAPPNVAESGLEASTPTAVPAVVTTSMRPAPGTTGYDVALPSGATLTIAARASAAVLPRAGGAGVVLPMDATAAARPLGDEGLLPDQVWLSATAPADLPARLAAAGVAVQDVETVQARAAELARQGPSLAAGFLLAGAFAAALLALAAAVVTLYLLARRRSFELAALRALGFGPGSVRAAAVAEPVGLAVAAVVLGVPLGVLAARVGLPGVPEFADAAGVLPVPPILVRVDPLLVLATAAVLALALGAGVLAGGLLLTRSARPERLREGQA